MDFSKRPLIIAHRGASSEFPENTLEAFTAAVEKHQVDMIELDVRPSREGTPVVIHDSRLERTTNGEGHVSQTPLGIIQQLKIPTLEEVLIRLPQTPLAVELKPKSASFVHAVMGLLKRYRRESTVIVGSAYDSVSRTLKQTYPEVFRFCSRTEVLRLLIEKLRRKTSPAEPRTVASVPTRYFGIRFDTKEWIDFLHAKEIKAFFWTVDEPEMIRKLAALGADGIVTNRPETAVPLLSVPGCECQPACHPQ